MAKQPQAAAIDPDRVYRIAFSHTFEHDGRKYIPRHGQTVKVKGRILEEIKAHLDTYEAI